MADTDQIARMRDVLARQKAAHIRDGAPTLEQRTARIDRALALLTAHKDEIIKALNDDFGNRAAEVSGITDIGASMGPLRHAKANLKTWMKPEKRKTTPAILGLFGAKAEVVFQPKGTVGIISPWNFPVNLTFAPLAGVLAADALQVDTTRTSCAAYLGVEVNALGIMTNTECGGRTLSIDTIDATYGALIGTMTSDNIAQSTAPSTTFPFFANPL